MKTRSMQTALSIAITVMLVLVVFAVITLANPMTPTRSAAADGLGGILGQQKFAPLISGTQVYTTSPIYSTAAYVGSYGSVNVMVANVVTGSQVITVTPQFSLQDLACASVTKWYSSTTYLNYQPYSVSTNSNTVTETVGPWQAAPVVDQFSIAGSNVAQREISAVGTCLRVKIEFSNQSQRYTPTVIIRALNRN